MTRPGAWPFATMLFLALAVGCGQAKCLRCAPSPATSSMGSLSPASSAPAGTSPSAPGAVSCGDPGTPSAPVDDATRRLLESLVKLQAKLGAERTREVMTPDYDLQLSPTARRLLTDCKHTARQAIQRLLQAMGSRHELCDDTLSDAIWTAFKNAGVQPAAASWTPGLLTRLQIHKVPGEPARWIAKLGLALACGDDQSLYVLQEQPDRSIKLVLAAESTGYASITKGQLAIAGQLSPPDATGNYYLVEAHAMPWCSSFWRGLHYRVLEPGPTPDSPKVLFEQSSDARVESEEVAEILVRADGFEVRFESWDRLGDEIIRPHIHNYRRVGQSFERIQPYTTEAKYLPGEWLSLPWDKAKAITTAGSQEALQPWHKRLSIGLKEEMGSVSVEREDKAGGKVRVLFQCGNCRALPQKVHFDLVKDGPGYAVMGIEEGP